MYRTIEVNKNETLKKYFTFFLLLSDNNFLLQCSPLYGTKTRASKRGTGHSTDLIIKPYPSSGNPGNRNLTCIIGFIFWGTQIISLLLFGIKTFVLYAMPQCVGR